MAEDKISNIPARLGRRIEGAGGSTNTTYQQLADFTRSGISPDLKHSIGAWLQLKLSRTGYMDLYPQWYTPAPFYPLSYGKGWAEERKIEDLSSLLGEYRGPEGSMIRWLIGNRIKDLRYKVARERGVTEARPPEYKPPPVPDWMKQYLTPATVDLPGRPGTHRGLPATKEVGELQLLGAQEELTPEQMGEMAGYQAWFKAGAPTEFSKEAVRQMSDWQRHWTPYTRESQSLFPKQQKLTPKWATARQ